MRFKRRFIDEYAGKSPERIWCLNSVRLVLHTTARIETKSYFFSFIMTSKMLDGRGYRWSKWQKLVEVLVKDSLVTVDNNERHHELWIKLTRLGRDQCPPWTLSHLRRLSPFAHVTKYKLSLSKVSARFEVWGSLVVCSPPQTLDLAYRLTKCFVIEPIYRAFWVSHCYCYCL